MPRSKRPSEPDPRHKPFVDFAFESYREQRKETLVIVGRDIAAVRDMLKATRAHMEEYSLENLQRYWLCFLERATAFERRQPPLYWFCTHLNYFAATATLNGKLTKRQESTEVMKTWLKDRLKKT